MRAALWGFGMPIQPIPHEIADAPVLEGIELFEEGMPGDRITRIQRPILFAPGEVVE